MTRSLSERMSNISPRHPSAFLKPQDSASSHDFELSLSPIATLMSFTPASSRESLMFWAWAGAYIFSKVGILYTSICAIGNIRSSVIIILPSEQPCKRICHPKKPWYLKTMYHVCETVIHKTIVHTPKYKISTCNATDTWWEVPFIQNHHFEYTLYIYTWSAILWSLITVLSSREGRYSH